MDMEIGSSVYLRVDFETARTRVTDALKVEGFGVLTEIAVEETLKQKLNVDFRRYTILGACNPALAYRALTSTLEVGLLLPCNVTLTELDDGRTQITVINPLAMMGGLHNDTLRPVAQEAAERLSRVTAALQAQASELAAP